MVRSKTYLILIILLVPSLALGFQITDKTGSTLSSITNPGAAVYEKRYVPANDGSKLLFVGEQVATIYAKRGVYKENINIDLEKNLLQFKKNNQLQHWELYNIDSAILGDITIISSLGPLKGCLIVYSETGYTLINKKSAKLKESNYNSALDSGNRNNQWIVNNGYYVLIPQRVDYVRNRDEGLIELPKSKKKLAKKFANPDVVLFFMKTEKLNLTEAKDLVILLNKFANDLVK